MSNIVIISGSPANPSRSSAITSYLEKKLHKEGLVVDKISVRDFPADDLLFANFNSPEIKEKLSLIHQARAVIIVSPVYKASYPGALKAFIDLIPEKGFENKLILPVVTGGTIAHLLSIEYAFKPLFSILGSEAVLNGVYSQDSQISYKDDQLRFIDKEIEQRLQNTIHRLVNRLGVEQARV